MPAVSFQAISKTFATPKGPFQALNQVNLDIEEGEFFGLLGPNGAGKTTLISILAGLARSPWRVWSRYFEAGVLGASKFSTATSGSTSGWTPPTCRSR